jgi:hypothetical protein
MFNARFWDDMVTEILSALADRWPDSDKNTVSSADRWQTGNRKDGGVRTSQEYGMMW